MDLEDLMRKALDSMDKLTKDEEQECNAYAEMVDALVTTIKQTSDSSEDYLRLLMFANHVIAARLFDAASEVMSIKDYITLVDQTLDGIRVAGALMMPTK